MNKMDRNPHGHYATQTNKPANKPAPTYQILVIHGPDASDFVQIDDLSETQVCRILLAYAHTNDIAEVRIDGDELFAPMVAAGIPIQDVPRYCTEVGTVMVANPNAPYEVHHTEDDIYPYIQVLDSYYL